MTQNWFHRLREMVVTEGKVVRVNVVRTKGSAPNCVGSAMTVSQDSFIGTIGGGALEFEALREARKMVQDYSIEGTDLWRRETRNYPLGPGLGQCCGGFVQLLFEPLGMSELEELKNFHDDVNILLRPLTSGQPWEFSATRKDHHSNWPLPVRCRVRELHAGARPRKAALIGDWYIEPLKTELQPLFLYGAGHVGRAVIKVFEDLPFKIYWIDTGQDRFPDSVPETVEQLVAVEPAEVARYAPAGAWHIVMTYSHRIDFDICHVVLQTGAFGYLGVIASKTKRARFIKRLRDLSIPESLIAQLEAPIGLAGLEGKEPAVIAVSLAADLLRRLPKSVEKREPLVTRKSKEAV